MKREWMEGPARQTVETPFGPADFLAVGGSVMVDANSNGKSFTVRGSEVSFSAHFNPQPDGSWAPRAKYDHGDPGEYPWVYMTKRHKFEDASWSAMRFAVTKLAPVVAAWAKEHEADLLKSVVADRNNTLSRIEDDLEEAAAKVAALEEKQAAAQQDLKAAQSKLRNFTRTKEAA